MPFQATQLLTACEVPQAYCVVPGAGGEAAAVRSKDDGLYGASMSFEAAQLLAAGQVAQDFGTLETIKPTTPCIGNVAAPAAQIDPRRPMWAAYWFT